MTIDLRPDELSLLLELLERDLGDLKGEISNTDDSQFHDALKARERVLVSLIDKVKRSQQP